MILSGLKIKEEVLKGNIFIEPFDEKLLNPNSYNYRLGEILYEITDDIIDPKKKCNYKIIKIPDEGYILKPNTLYLGNTQEKIGSKKYVTQLIGRSSVGRMGMFLQVTAPLGHIGCNHNWTLEIKVIEPLKVYKNMRIGQVTFWKTYGNRNMTYKKGEYNKYKLAEVSKFYKEV